MVELAHPLIFIRHGQTDWNKERRLQGQKDIPLNALGISQAKRNGRQLRDVFEDQGFDPAQFGFVSSPLSRCRHTAELALREAGFGQDRLVFDDQLKEITFGDWEGFTYPELEAREPGSLTAREALKWSFVPPGGESYEMVSARVERWLRTVNEPLVVISHGGISRALRGIIFQLPGDEITTLDVPQDKLFLVQDGQGIWL